MLYLLPLLFVHYFLPNRKIGSNFTFTEFASCRYSYEVLGHWLLLQCLDTAAQVTQLEIILEFHEICTWNIVGKQPHKLRAPSSQLSTTLITSARVQQIKSSCVYQTLPSMSSIPLRTPQNSTFHQVYPSRPPSHFQREAFPW